MPTPMATWTKTATSTTPVNHHRARVRTAGTQWAPSDHRPARPFPMITTHAQPTWRSRSRVLRGAAGGGAPLQGERFVVGLGGHLDQLVDLGLAEPRQLAEAAGEVHRRVLLLAAEAAEGEQLVDR